MPNAKSIRLAIVSLILVPAIAAAQRPGGAKGKMGSDKDDPKSAFDQINKSNEGALKLSNRDVEDLDPLKLLVDKKKDMKLSDDLVKQLKDLDGKLKTKNEPLFKVLDSLRTVIKPKNSPSDDDKLKAMVARNDVGVIVTNIRANYDAAAKEALPLLDAGQQKTATDLLAKQNKEAEEMLTDKLGGRKGGG